jgi:hypothetical protein
MTNRSGLSGVYTVVHSVGSPFRPSRLFLFIPRGLVIPSPSAVVVFGSPPIVAAFLKVARLPTFPTHRLSVCSLSGLWGPVAPECLSGPGS